MTKLHIPTIGARMRLAEPWRFTLHDEYRNHGFVDMLGLLDPDTPMGDLLREARAMMARSRGDLTDVTRPSDLRYYLNNDIAARRVDPVRGKELLDAFDAARWDVTLPEGTVLILDRLYIRKGTGDFDSLTFMVESIPDGVFRHPPTKKNEAFGRKPRFWASLTDCNRMDVEFL